MKGDEKAFCDLLMPFVLGELSDHDFQAFLRHVQTCAHCREELEAIWPVHLELMTMEETRVANDLQGDLKRRTLEKAFSTRAPRVGDDASRVSSVHASQPQPMSKEHATSRFSRRRGWTLLPYALSVAMLFAGIWIGAGIKASPGSFPSSQDTTVPSTWVRNTSLVSTAYAPTAYGQVTIVKSGRMQEWIVQVFDLTPIKGHGCYTVWLLEDGSRTLGGKFTVNRLGEGAVTIRLPLTVTYSGVGITLEPHVNDQTPQGPKVLGASLLNV